MKTKPPSNTPLVKLPREADLALFLIQEELKSSILQNRFKEMGFDGRRYNSDFSELIFSLMGLDPPTPQFNKWYAGQLAVFCQEIDLQEEGSLSKQALEFYVHLQLEKRNEKGEK